MNTFYTNKKHIKSSLAFIDGEDFHHIKNVLRVKTGEEAYICDDDGHKYKAKLTKYTDNSADFEIIGEIQESVESKVNITLIQGFPKKDKLELIIQKATELGAKEIVPVIMERSIAKYDEDKDSTKLERWQKIAKEASRTKWKKHCSSGSKAELF